MTVIGTVRIAGHGIEAVVVPACGGLTASARQHNRPLLYAPEQSEFKPGTIHYFGNWPLVPFANRAFGAVLRFGTETLALPANDPEEPGNTLHGFSWQAPWEVVTRQSDHVRLRHRQVKPAGPYLYVAEQTISASPNGLTSELSVTNSAARALPFGLGFHPWFPRDADTEIALAADSTLALGDGYRPLSMAAPGPGTDFSAPRRLDGSRETAIQFCGSRGPAQFRYPSRGYRLVMDWENAPCPLLWSPRGAGFFCLEPQTHALGAPSDAIAHKAGPLATLSPGATLAIRMTLRIDSL